MMITPLSEVPTEGIMHPVKSISDFSILSGEATIATAVDSESASVSEFSSDDLRRVTFGPIHVREFERIVGDHPDTRVGVPLSIGWGYHERQPVSIERFEADRLPKESLRMSSITRKNMLHQIFGIPEEELRAAEKEVQKIRKGREQTNKSLKKKSKKADSKLKSFGKKFFKALTSDTLIRGISAAASGGMVLPAMPH